MAAKDIYNKSGSYGAGVLSNIGNFTLGIKKGAQADEYSKVIEKSSITIKKETEKLASNILSVFKFTELPDSGERVATLSSKLESLSTASDGISKGAFDIAKYLLLIPLLLNDKVKSFVTGFFTTFLEGLGAPKALIESMGFLLKNLNYIIATYFGYKLFQAVSGAFSSVTNLLKEMGLIGTQLEVATAELQMQKSVLSDKEAFEKGVDKEGKKVQAGVNDTKGELKNNKKKGFLTRLKLLGQKIAPKLVSIVKNFIKALPIIGTVVGVALIAYELFSIGQDIFDFVMGNDEKEAKSEVKDSPKVSEKVPVTSLLDQNINPQNQSVLVNDVNTKENKQQTESVASIAPVAYSSTFFKQTPGESKELFGERMKQYALSQGYPAVASMGVNTKSLPASFSPIVSSFTGSKSFQNTNIQNGNINNSSGSSTNTLSSIFSGGTSSSPAGESSTATEPRKSSSAPLSMPLMDGSLGMPAATSSISSGLMPMQDKGEAVLRQSESYSINEIAEQPAIINILNINNSKNVLVASNG